MVLRIGVPVFVAPEPVSGDPVLRWRLIQSSPTRVTARATNLGNTHVEIRDLELFSTNGAPAVARRAVSTTVLAAQSRDWIFELDRPLQDPRVHLTADTGSGHLDGGVLAVLARKPVDR